MAAKEKDGRRIVAENRQARHEYFLTETWEAGLRNFFAMSRAGSRS